MVVEAEVLPHFQGRRGKKFVRGGKKKRGEKRNPYLLQAGHLHQRKSEEKRVNGRAIIRPKSLKEFPCSTSKKGEEPSPRRKGKRSFPN